MRDSIVRRERLGARSDVRIISQQLKPINAAVSSLGALFVMDPDGLTLASSDFDQPGSRVGRFQTLREMVERVHRESRVSIEAPSLTTGRPGWLVAVAVVEGAHVIGGAAARVEADSITRLLASNEEDVVLVADSLGRVLAASDARLVLHTIALSARQPDSTALRLPAITAVMGAGFDGPDHDVERRHAWVTIPMAHHGLTLHMIRGLPEVGAQITDTRTIAALVWLSGIFVLVARARGLRQLAAIAGAERAAKAEQQRVRDILNTSYDAVVTVNLKNQVVDWNARAEVMFGYPASEIVGSDLTERVIPQQWRAAHAKGFAAATHTRRSDVFGKPRELTAINRKGEEFPIELTMSPARDAEGKTLFVAFFRDIRDRKAEEAARAASAERKESYRSAALDLAEREKDSWDDGLRLLLGEAKRVIGVEQASYWNLDESLESLTCERMLRGDREDLGVSSNALRRDSAPAYFRALRRRQPIVADDAVQHEALREFADSYLRPSGIASVLDTPVWFEGKQVGVLSFAHVGLPRTWEPETVEFATTIAAQIGLLRESVRRVESERELNEQRARMELIMKLSPIAQVVWDSEKGLIYGNPAMVKLFGYPSDAAMRGLFAWDVSSPTQPDGADSRVKGHAYVTQCMTEGLAAFEWTYRKAGGAEFPAAVTLVRLSEGGSLRLSTIIDLTEVKAAQAAIVAAKDAAEQAEATKSAFLATMSHEIRTPMNGVMSMAEMLDQTDLDEDQRGMLQVVRSSADALLTIINDILDVSKIEAGKMTLEDVEMSPASIIEDVAQLLAGRAQEKKIAIYPEIDASLPAAMLGDPTRIRQIVVNLAGNALKFTETGFVRVRAGLGTTSRLRIDVTDTGIGLTAEQCSRLFQPFMQADSSTARKFGGTGLGLSICRRLVELMGGEIGVDSTFGSGSTFWFEIPLRALALPSKPEVAIDDLQILLAGFSKEQARILESYVEAAGARPPVFCVRPDDAVERLRADPALAPIVVLPTYPAEGSGGLQIARVIRELPFRDKTAVCLIVPSTLISSASAAAQTGFIATTSEPVRRDRFWRMLAVAAGRATAERRARPASQDTRYVAPPAEVAAEKGAMILVAEDNRTNQLVIGRLLSQMGLVHEIAENGAIALRRLKADRSKFGLLLSDFHMPEMDGFELTRVWRGLERKGDVVGRLPIIALTADALAGMADRCREAGMDGYLTKPIVRDRLTEELDRWLPVAFELRTEATDAPVRPDNRANDDTSARKTAVLSANDAVDLVAFARQLGIEPGVEARELLVSLWDSLSGLGAELHQALDAKNRTELRDCAHAGKGAAYSIGASHLGELCGALQDESQSVDWMALGTRVSEALAEHERVRVAVAALSLS